MSGFLLDTNVISELVRAKPDARVVAWIRATDESLLHLSVLTLGEIRKGVSLLPSSSRRTRLESWLDTELTDRFAGRILAVDQSVAERWGRLTAASRSAPFPVIDGLLAATALHHDLTLVSRDLSPAARANVPCFDPWAS